MLTGDMLRKWQNWGAKGMLQAVGLKQARRGF